MAATLSRTAAAPLLRAGVQPAIASGEGDSRTAIEMELISVLDSASFRASARSRAFLRFVVEEALAGRETSLKERTIGVAVLGKDASYDTGSDAVVRVRANDVRKRLLAHYECCAPKAGVRIELPSGSYIPRFVGNLAQTPQPAAAMAKVPPMLLWQLAAPTLFALFLVLIAIRADVEANDSFSRFWSTALAGRSEIMVEVDSASDGVSISPAMAEVALPLSIIASSFRLPVHIAAAGRQPSDPRACVVRLSTTSRPSSETNSWNVAGATLFYASNGDRVLWLFARDTETLTRAVQNLADRSVFPEIH
jgi:hypothetical protein